ncbi:MAG: hypothetical protein PHD04_00945 [Candidatus Pacebacteria bacterium]|nr:hypothetical protein [Candidatus Paceibacterota bacterium]
MNTEKKAQQIMEKINGITAQKTPVIATHYVRDESVQAELRLHAEWAIRVPVDEIHFPKRIAPTPDDFYRSGMDKTDPWCNMSKIAISIAEVSRLSDRSYPNPQKRWENIIIKINLKTKTGPERRSEAKNQFLVDAGSAFLADYRAATKKSNLAKIRKQITTLQSQQKALLPKLREANSLYLAGKKTEREAQKIKNAEALKSGKFWEADADTLKSYFHPPFDKNYVADVSEKWRACLILECESVSYRGYNDEWRHKLSATGDAYLCGIDDNGDEWGHHCHVPLSRDNYGNGGFDATVEEAMCDLFDISPANLAKCQRQGDLLFCPVKIRTEDGPEHCERCGGTKSQHYESTETSDDGQRERIYLACHYPGCFQEYNPHIHKAPLLEPTEKWTPRESHEITSPSLYRNGRYFRAADEITVTHTSHAAVTLPPGEYRLYMSRIANAD